MAKKKSKTRLKELIMKFIPEGIQKKLYTFPLNLDGFDTPSRLNDRDSVTSSVDKAGDRYFRFNVTHRVSHSSIGAWVLRVDHDLSKLSQCTQFKVARYVIDQHTGTYANEAHWYIHKNFIFVLRHGDYTNTRFKTLVKQLFNEEAVIDE